jgi:hypothetical protein
MAFRGPDPFLGGINTGITVIAVSGICIVIWLLTIVYTGVSFGLFLFVDLMIIAHLAGWTIFISNLQRHSKPHQMPKQCPFCGRDLSWDNIYKVWFCFTCERKIKRQKESFKL